MGDCVTPSGGTGEVACSSPKALGTVDALVADAGGCPPDAANQTSRSHEPKVACVAPGPVPTCYDDPTVAFGGTVVDCNGSTARRVTARAATAERCPAGTATYDDDSALPPARVQCLTELPAA